MSLSFPPLLQMNLVFGWVVGFFVQKGFTDIDHVAT